jgi:hypothetical protein
MGRQPVKCEQVAHGTILRNGVRAVLEGARGKLGGKNVARAWK